MSVERKCPTCGAELAAGAVDGLCLKCLGRLGFVSEGAEPAAGGLLRLGDYELLEEIARGGMGVVYRARQLSLNRIVALKVVLHGPFSSPDFVRRFRNEAEAIAALRHPNIVSIYEIGVEGGHHFLALEYVEGQSFAELARERPLPARRAAGYLKTVAEAVAYAHQRGVLHRDLKPSNILLDVFDQPRVTDFGLAKLLHRDADLTTTGEVLGSPSYMAPEQAAGKGSKQPAQSDVYSLGAILYQLITGHPPFQGETLQATLAHVQSADPVLPRRLNPGVPADLQTICLKCLQKDPARRYATAQELAEDLGRFLEGKPIRARPVTPIERLWLWCRRRPLVASMIAGLLLTALLGGAGIAWQWRKAERHAQGELQLRLLAENYAAETRISLYAADLALAAHAVQDNNFGLANRTLDSLRPSPGQPDLRGFEWYYLRQQCHGQQLATLTGHEGIVGCVTFSPDGRRLATGGHDGTVRIWDVHDHRTLAVLNVSTASVWSVIFTPDGKSLFTASMSGVVQWDLATGQPGRKYRGQLASLAKAGSLLATSEANPFFWEPGGTVRLWDWRTGQMRRQLERSGRAVALSDDGRLLAVAGTNSGLAVWETDSGRLVHDWPTTNSVWALSFSPDGHRLLSACWSTNAILWSLDRDSPPAFTPSTRLHLWSAVFSHDGALIAAVSSDQTVRLWDAATLQLKAALRGHESEVWCAAFSPDDKLLATGGKDCNVLLWATTPPTSSETLPHDGDFRPLFSPDGKWLVTTYPHSTNRYLWDADQRTLLATNLAGGRQIVGFSPDGKRVATFDSTRLRLRFWQPQREDSDYEVVLQTPAPFQMPAANLGMSPAQDFFFATDGAGRIRVWNAVTGRLARSFSAPPPPVRAGELSAQGRYLAVSAESEWVAHLYDCATGVQRTLAAHRDFVDALAFSADAATLATASVDGTIRLWSTATGALLATLPGHMQETTDVAFSPDGRTLASLARGESLKLWHLPTRREVLSEDFPQAALWLRFSPDGRKLAVETSFTELCLLTAPRE